VVVWRLANGIVIMTGTSGKLIGIARKAYRLAPVETLPSGKITLEAGLEGDHRGAKYPKRAVTILSIESWRDALNDLAGLAGPPDLDWTARRANLLVEGIRLPRAAGAIVQIGPVVLEVTDETNPCNRMEEAQAGLLSALTPEWRGGVCCRVIEGGSIALGEHVKIVSSPPDEKKPNLPG
jgi:MOSC domain-containing protein YiiM